MTSVTKYKELLKIFNDTGYRKKDYWPLYEELDFIWEKELTKEERHELNFEET